MSARLHPHCLCRLPVCGWVKNQEGCPYHHFTVSQGCFHPQKSHSKQPDTGQGTQDRSEGSTVFRVCFFLPANFISHFPTPSQRTHCGNSDSEGFQGLSEICGYPELSSYLGTKGKGNRPMRHSPAAAVQSVRLFHSLLIPVNSVLPSCLPCTWNVPVEKGAWQTPLASLALYRMGYVWNIPDWHCSYLKVSIHHPLEQSIPIQYLFLEFPTCKPLLELKPIASCPIENKFFSSF